MKKAIFAVVLFAFIAQAMLLAQQVTDVNIATLVSEINNNKARANQTYNNRTLRLTGVIWMLTDETRVWLAANSLSWDAIPIDFNSSERTKVINLNKGQRITVTGVYRDGGIRNAVIGTGAATIARPEPAPTTTPVPAARTTPTPAPAPAPTPTPNNTTQARTANERGIAFYNQKNWDSAIAEFTRAVNLDPKNATYLTNLGAAYTFSDKPDYLRALLYLGDAIALAPNFVDSYLHRAYIWANEGNLIQARADVNKALQIDPNLQRAKDYDVELKQRGY